MKLKEWAEKQGISYLTAWRWFKAEDPRLANAYQSDSGTIIVPDENEFLEQNMANNYPDAMSLFLKKTVEFSKNNSTVEDFAAYVVSTFQLKLNFVPENPKYSKQKPRQEEIQKHFQQFMPDKEREEHLKAVKVFLKEQENKIQVNADPELCENLTKALRSKMSFIPYDHIEGSINQNVDSISTPQTINSTYSTDPPFNNSFYLSSASGYIGPLDSNINLQKYSGVSCSSFNLTEKEIKSTDKIIETVELESVPRRRGRKPLEKKI